MPWRSYSLHPSSIVHAKMAALQLILTSVAWANVTTADFDRWISAAVAGGSALVLAYIALRGMLDKHEREKRAEDDRIDREKRRRDFDDEMELRKRREALDRDSLTAKIDSLQTKAAQDAEESRVNQEKMRDSLHEIRGQLQARMLENESLRSDLATANANFLAASRDLVTANRRIAELTQEVSRLTAMESRCIEGMRGVAKDVKDLVAGRSGEIPAYVPPPPPPGGGPAGAVAGPS